jgi:hypothetical protein
MATTTACATSLLYEAAAIVEAEWIRLQQDVALWERELANLSSELPAPRPGPPRVGVTTTARRWPSQSMPHDRRRWPTRPWPATPVWATQRSPPSSLGVLLKGIVVTKGGDATTDDHQLAMTLVSPTYDSDVA